MYIESLSAARLSRVTLVRSFPTSIRRSIRMQNAYIGVFFLLLASRMGGELRLFGKRIAAPVLAGGSVGLSSGRIMHRIMHRARPIVIFINVYP